MVHLHFARKLRLTAVALGCTSRKALCARFRAVNPETVCDTDRLYKWMQGRAMPRGKQFFEDWRRVIASPHDAVWLETSSVEGFAEDLARGVGITLDQLWLEEKRQQRNTGETSAILGSKRTLYGAFACYSHAWSPAHGGKLIRGSLRIGPGPHGPQAVYQEMLLGGGLQLAGDVGLAGGMMHVLLREGASGMPLFLNMIAPGPPASVLCGMLAGPTLIAHTALPSATRLVAVRSEDVPALDATNGYIAADAASVSEDLAALGLVGSAMEAATALVRFLGDGAQQVSVADQLALCELLDPVAG